MDLISLERLFLVLSGYFYCKLLNTGKKNTIRPFHSKVDRDRLVEVTA